MCPRGPGKVLRTAPSAPRWWSRRALVWQWALRGDVGGVLGGTRRRQAETAACSASRALVRAEPRPSADGAPSSGLREPKRRPEVRVVVEPNDGCGPSAARRRGSGAERRPEHRAGTCGPDAPAFLRVPTSNVRETAREHQKPENRKRAQMSGLATDPVHACTATIRDAMAEHEHRRRRRPARWASGA